MGLPAGLGGLLLIPKVSVLIDYMEMEVMKSLYLITFTHLSSSLLLQGVLLLPEFSQSPCKAGHGILLLPVQCHTFAILGSLQMLFLLTGTLFLGHSSSGYLHGWLLPFL